MAVVDVKLFELSEVLTIVIPCKNEERYIGELLLDLTFQYGFDDTRIIIADAHSSDNTRAIIEQFTHFLNIEVVEGGNVSVGRNNGAALVTTPYVLFLDADVRFFTNTEIYDSVRELHENNLDLITLNIKNYSNDIRATMLFTIFNWCNKILTRTTPFAIGAFFLTRMQKFQEVGGFPNLYETSEDYILSRQYSPAKFRIVDHHFGQDDRRFRKLGYLGMMKYMIVNFFNRHNLGHFKKIKVNYWK